MVAVGNEFELSFAKFLEDAPDVDRFAKLPEQFGFAIEYTDSKNNLRYYEPDFVAVTTDGKHYLVETKGREDVDVANKDRAASLWCENATRLTRTSWEYIKVPQKEFEKLRPSEFEDIRIFQKLIWKTSNIKISAIKNDKVFVVGGDIVEISIDELDNVNPRLLAGDSSTDAPPPKSKKKRKK